MKKLLSPVLMSIFLVSCNLATSLNETPSSTELLENPETLNQIRRIEAEEPDRFTRRLTDLINEGHVSTTPNGTEPVTIILGRTKPSEVMVEEEFQSNPDAFYEPTHDREQVEEYFVDEEFVNEVEDEANIDSPSEADQETITEVDNSNNPEVVEQTDSDGVEETITETEEIEEESDPISEIRPQMRPDDLVPSSEDEEVDEPSIIQASWDGRSYATEYTDFLVEGLNLYGEDLLTNGQNVLDDGFCSNYNELNRNQRIQFWVMMISTISKHESGFNTDAKYLERSGEYSRGLLQLGFSSTKQRAYSCGFESKYEINSNPRKNLHCGVKIMNHWIKRDQVIRADQNGSTPRWLGSARYWSVVRFAIWNQEKQERLYEIKQNTSELLFCMN